MINHASMLVDKKALIVNLGSLIDELQKMRPVAQGGASDGGFQNTGSDRRGGWGGGH